MRDPYSIDTSRNAVVTQNRREPADRTAIALWVVLAICIALNVVVSSAHPDNALLSVAFGIPTALSIVALVMRYLRRRR